MRSTSLFRLIFARAPANFKSCYTHTLEGNTKDSRSQKRLFALLQQQWQLLCCVCERAPAEKRRIMDMEICS